MARSGLLCQEAECYPTVDDRYEAEKFYTPLAEGRGPRVFWLDSDLESDGEMSANEESAEISTSQGSHAGTRRRSDSDSVAAHRNHTLRSTLSPISVHFHEDERVRGTRPPPQTPISLHPSRPIPQRSTSTSWVDVRPRSRDRPISSADLQQQLVDGTQPIGPLFRQSGRTQHEMAAVTSRKASSDDDRPNPRSRNTQSSSDLDVHETSVQTRKTEPGTPLKPCLKRKAKSASNTLPVGARRNDHIENRVLRRVKTVDFVKSDKLPLTTQPRTVKSKRSIDIDPNAPPPSATTNKNVHSAISCPEIMSIAKGGLISPAVTRTDVHVVAVASSWNGEDFADEEIDTATPTMQIVESKNSSYELIWDDVPEEDSIKIRRPSSSASQVLESVNPMPSYGLERVNTKLTDWRGNRGRSSESFKPTIVVSPDDDGRPTHCDCEPDSEQIFMSAPPNSQITSAASSRIPSRPASAPMSRRASEEETALQPFSEKLHVEYNRDRANSAERLLHSEHRPGRLIRASRGKRRLSAPRKLSNIEEADLHFRGHRDSVAIARSHLVNSGGISPELFAHRDSVSIAKKRMHAKNHATSVARRQPGISSEILDDEVPLLPTTKECASQTLDSQNLESILSQHQEATQRHIQIVE